MSRDHAIGAGDDLRAAMEREALAVQHRRRVAGMIGGRAMADPDSAKPSKRHGPDYFERVEAERRAPNANFHRVDDIRQMRAANYIEREPCQFCGVRMDLHAEHGCRKWRALR